MRFIVDECTGPTVAEWLKTEGHDVLSVYDEARGSTDAEILGRAYREDRILISNDKDFGDKVFREHFAHKGVVLLRLEDSRTASKIDTLRRLLQTYANRLSDQFVVVTEDRVRLAQQDRPLL